MTLTSPNRDWLALAVDLLRQERRIAVAAIVGPEGNAGLGKRAVLWQDGAEIKTHSEFELGEVMVEIRSKAGQAIAAQQVLELGTAQARIVIIPYGQPDEAWTFGAGHIAQALVPLLVRLGWRAVVCDDRPEYASATRFPDAHAIHVADFADLADLCARRAHPWVILITRGHEHDEQILRRLVRTPLRYLGMIGSKRRVAAVRQRLERAGVSTGFLDGIHAPIGIPIGADSPAEIAVSILAELIAVRRGAGLKPPSTSVADTSNALPLWERIFGVLEDGRPAVLATIVERRGSTPRGLGAQMAVFADGSIAGTIGGGCGEEDIRRAAKELLLSSDRSRSISVDLTGDPTSETTIDVCGGRYSVLLDRI